MCVCGDLVGDMHQGVLRPHSQHIRRSPQTIGGGRAEGLRLTLLDIPQPPVDIQHEIMKVGPQSLRGEEERQVVREKCVAESAMRKGYVVLPRCVQL